MAHEIFGERFIGMRAPAWHALGTVLTDQVSAGEAIRIAGIDYEYVSTPVGYNLPDGTFMEDGARKVVLRAPTADDPTYRRLGIVASDYQFLQNVELARGLDALAERTGWTFETAGALGQGGTVFMTLDAGTETVFGDEYRQYVLVSDGKATGRALRVSVVPTRVVCQNTLVSAESAASFDVRVPHGRRVGDDYTFWTDMVGVLEDARRGTFDALRSMAEIKITDETARQIIEAAYPLPAKNTHVKMAESLRDLDGLSDEVQTEVAERLARGTYAHDYWTRKAIESRDAAWELYDRFNGGDEQGGRVEAKVLKKIAKTPYAALQAVTELADWSGTATPAQAGTSALFGDRAKVKRRAWLAAGAASGI